MSHLKIRSDYPGEPNLHLFRHHDGDIGIAVADGDRWPGFSAMTVCQSGGQYPELWHMLSGLFSVRVDGKGSDR